MLQSVSGQAPCAHCSPAIARHQSCRAPSSAHHRRGHRALPRASALPDGHHQLYLTADADVLDSKQSKEGLLEALLERANAEAQRRAGGAVPESSGASQGAMPPSPSAADEVLDRIPGSERMTSGVAELIEGSRAASGRLQTMMEGALPPQSASGGSGGKGSVLESINFREAFEGATSRLKSVPEAFKQGPGSPLQGNPLEGLGQGLGQGGAAMESITAAPSRVSASLGAAAEGARTQLDSMVQAVGAVVLPGSSPTSSQLLESRRAAGHLVDLTPIYKAWSTLVQPFAFFGDRWLLNILFLVVFVLLSFTLLAKAPRQ